jgi:glyoxylase-like metal-dependent hydrolase (beta-lactamase superfamily II)
VSRIDIGSTSEPRARTGAWAEPACQQVAPGVFRIPLPLPGDGLTAVNVYAIPHEGRVTLIDSGWSFGPGLEVLADGLARMDLDLQAIDRVLVTHFHRDHFTLGIRLRQLFGTRVLLGVGERENVENVVSGRSDGQLSWLTRWGAERLRSAIEALPSDPRSEFGLPDEWIEAPTVLEVGSRRLRAVPTPGHTRGHLVFADEDHGLLFAGDHVLPRITPSIGVESLKSELPLGDYLASLQLMHELPDLDLLPAHGAPGGRTHGRVDELLEHHRTRLSATAATVGSLPLTALDSAQALAWTRRERAFADLDPHNQMLAVAETAAHLDVLVRDGVLTSTDEDGTRTYVSRGAADAHRHE